MGNRDVNRNRSSETDDGGGGHREGVRATGGVFAGDDRPVAHTNRGRRPGWGSETVTAVAQQEGASRARRTDTRNAALDREALDTMIVQQWTKMLREPYDWAEWPLARYTLGDDVVHSVQGTARATVSCTHPGALRLAWVCAMVASGRAQRLRSLETATLTDPASDGEKPLVRSDGACAWRCNLRRSAPEGPQLYYWVHPSGLIEFEAVRLKEARCLA